ncbi:MFS transporter [Leptolyngbya sp. FACHB-541]|uniref:MFS transporter n=1 Tax=Leptolyngbya sp. FACHB-541 TaxID=2692810 RepID=UPI0016832B13|nr:MFS transporter [Leptolyngbya sp. FACHB-541]MBD1997450.1 MFS transporter [Leptolyngbya sp. FACHB-541]
MNFSDSRLLVLLAASSLIAMTGAILAPILPEMANSLHFETAQAGNLISFHFLTLAIFTPLLGILADRIGQIRLLLPSLICYAVFGISGVLMHSFTPLLATRALLGIANGGIAAAGLGLVSKLYQGEARAQAIAYVATTLTLANIVYPLIAGWIGTIDWHFVFGLYGLGIPLALWAAVVFYGSRQSTGLNVEALSTQKDTEKSSAESSQNATVSEVATPAQLFRQPQILKLLLCLALVSASVYALIVYLPIYMKTDMSSNTVSIGIVLATKAGGAALVSAFLVRRLVKQIGESWTIILGAVTMSLTLAAMPYLHQMQTLLPVAILFGFGFGIVVPTLYSSLAELAPDNLQSTVLATGTGVSFLAQFLSPILLGFVFTHSNLPTVFYTTALVALTVGLLNLLPKRSLVPAEE